MQLDWPRAFDLQMERLNQDIARGDERAKLIKQLVDAQLTFLMDEVVEPPLEGEETKQLRWVRQSKKNKVWRISHKFNPEAAVRTIVWFPEDGKAVILLFYGDKSHMGDVFYDTVGTRADQLISQYLQEIAGEKNA